MKKIICIYLFVIFLSCEQNVEFTAGTENRISAIIDFGEWNASFLSDEYREVHGILQDLSAKMSEIEALKSSIQTNKEESDILRTELEESLSSVDEMKISLINKTKAEIKTYLITMTVY